MAFSGCLRPYRAILTCDFSDLTKNVYHNVKVILRLFTCVRLSVLSSLAHVFLLRRSSPYEEYI